MGGFVSRSLGRFGRLIRRLHARFLSPSARRAHRRKSIEDAAFDSFTGFDTGGTQQLNRLTIVGGNSASGGPHIASPPEEFAQALSLVDLDLTGLTFVDFGSGKGRAMLMAAERPFKRLIGIEFARENYRVSLENFARRTETQGPDPRVELRNIDATQFDFPADPLLLYLYNPFDPPVLTMVIERALASWRANPRPMRALYMVPLFADEWTRAGWRLIAAQGATNLYAPPED